MKFDVVTGANFYIDGASQYGKAQEISGLEIKPVTVDINPIGMFGKTKKIVGIDIIELDVTWDFINEDVTDPFKEYSFKIYGNVVRKENGTERELPAYIELRGHMMDNNLLGTLKGQEWKGQKTQFVVEYILVKHDGEEILELDIEGNIWRDHGEDKLATMRKNARLN